MLQILLTCAIELTWPIPKEQHERQVVNNQSDRSTESRSSTPSTQSNERTTRTARTKLRPGDGNSTSNEPPVLTEESKIGDTEERRSSATKNGSPSSSPFGLRSKLSRKNPTLIVVTDPTYCGPCRSLESELIKLTSYGYYIQADGPDTGTIPHIVIVHPDQIPVSSIPTIIRLNPDGTESSRIVGAHTATQVADFYYGKR
jgi:hypothetical protein